MPVDDIRSLGMHEVKRIRGGMHNVVNQLEYNGNIDQFIQYLRIEKIYVKTTDELLKQASYISKKWKPSYRDFLSIYLVPHTALNLCLIMSYLNTRQAVILRLQEMTSPVPRESLLLP